MPTWRTPAPRWWLDISALGCRVGPSFEPGPGRLIPVWRVPPMTTPPSPWRALPLFVALLLGIAPALGLLPVVPPRAAEAFNPPVHIAMFEQALKEKFDLGGARLGGGRAHPLVTTSTGQGHAGVAFRQRQRPERDLSRTAGRAGPDALLDEAATERSRRFVSSPPTPKGSTGSARIATRRSPCMGSTCTPFRTFTHTPTGSSCTSIRPQPHSLLTLPSVAPVQKACDAKALAALQRPCRADSSVSTPPT